MRVSTVSRPVPWRVALVLAAAVVVPACGGGSGGSASLAGGTYTAPTAFVVPVSAVNFDSLQSAVATPSGDGFYAAGYVGGPAAGDPRVVIVVKILNNGSLDVGFDGDGIVVTTLATTGANDEIDIALQAQGGNAGKILVSTTAVQTGMGANTRDIGVIRLNADGSLDTTFAPGAPAGGGIRFVDLNPNNATDLCRSIAVDPLTDEIYLHGLVLATGVGRTDTDFAVVKLSANGDRDLTFAGGAGVFTLDINETNATPRALKAVLVPGGASTALLVSGYGNFFGPFPQLVIYKLKSDGTRFGGAVVFGGNSVYTGAPLELQTEVYNFAVHGDYLVTGGYGRDSGTRNDWVSLRLLWHIAAAPVPPAIGPGMRDMTWGGSPRGTSIVNPSSDPAIGSNCRNAVAMPGGKTLLLGSTGSAGTNTQDAAWVVLDASGYADVDYGAGAQVYKDAAFNDAFWGGAVNATHLIVVGTRSAAGANDNSFAAVIPIP